MSSIHVASPTGIRAEYREDQMQDLWDRGRLNADSLYWKEGMPDWRPLREYFSSPPAASDDLLEQPLFTKITQYTYTRDPQGLTAFLLLMLWISLAFDMIMLLAEFSQLALLNRPFTDAEATANDALQGNIGLGYTVVFIVTAVAFLKWIYRANLNSHGFGAQEMRFTPGWSIGWYFVPFLNIVRPYQVMKEIWKISQDPVKWQSQPGSAILRTWWTLWLLTGFASQMALRLSLKSETLEDIKVITIVSIISSIFGLLVCIAAITMIKGIAYRQHQLVTTR